MVMVRLVFCASLLASSVAVAQTADGGPPTPASHGLVGTPGTASRPAPSVAKRGANPEAKLPPSQVRTLPKPTAADRAEQRKLEHDSTSVSAADPAASLVLLIAKGDRMV